MLQARFWTNLHVSNARICTDGTIIVVPYQNVKSAIRIWTFPLIGRFQYVLHLPVYLKFPNCQSPLSKPASIDFSLFEKTKPLQVCWKTLYTSAHRNLSSKLYTILFLWNRRVQWNKLSPRNRCNGLPFLGPLYPINWIRC